MHLRDYLGAFIFILILTINSWAQEGDYYLTHHNPPADLVDNVNFSLIQDQNGIIWIANRKGIIQYDGVSWQLIPTPSAVFSLSIDKDNVLYGGGRNIIGKLSYDNTNQLYFSVLHSDPSLGDVLSTKSLNEKVLFLTEKNLYVYDSQIDSIRSYLDQSDLRFKELFNIEGQTIVGTESDGLFLINENEFELSPLGKFDSIDVRWLNQHSRSGTIAIIDEQSNIYISQGQALKQLTFEDDDYIKSSIPIISRWVTDSLLAVSTLSGGVVFIEPLKSTIDKIVNYHTGLPDNQVFTMIDDMDHGIWAAHDYGLTRIAPLMPFRSYGNFPGLEGNILTVTRHNGRIYVGTNLGVYFLDEVKDFEEIEFYVKSGQTQSKKLQSNEQLPSESLPNPEDSEDSEETKDDKKEKKGLFGFLRKKNQDEETELPSGQQQKADAEEPIEQTAETTKKKRGFLSRLFGGQEDTETDRIQWERRTKKELLAIRYLFKKIEEIPAKTNLLIKNDDLFLSAGLSGIHEIQGDSASTISEIPVRYAYFSETNKILFASTFNNEILSFAYNDGDWQAVDILEGLQDYIFQITGQDNSIWLISADSLYRIELDYAELVDVDVFPVNNPYFEETFAVNQENKLYFVNSSGYFYYDPSTRAILEDESLRKSWGAPERLFVGSGNNVWIFNGKEWNILGEGNFNRSNFEFLNVFHEIRQLYYSSENDQFWIVTAQNKIYEITPAATNNLFSHNIYLKEIRKQNNILLPEPKLRIQLENSSLTFKFIQPEYSGLMGIEYQYRLAGLTDEWSNWDTENNIITFSYLPAGQYAMEFQTRDVFGEINSIQPIEFNVIDPYWRRPWFYAIEVVIFSMLLFLSIRLNRANTRYRIVSRLLAFLTLILIIEFIQTIAEYKFETDASPVIDFFIQVSIALVVLPFESLLRRAIFRSKAVDISLAGLGKKSKSEDAKKGRKTKKKVEPKIQ